MFGDSIFTGAVLFTRSVQEVLNQVGLRSIQKRISDTERHTGTQGEGCVNVRMALCPPRSGPGTQPSLQLPASRTGRQQTSVVQPPGNLSRTPNPSVPGSRPSADPVSPYLRNPTMCMCPGSARQTRETQKAPSCPRALLAGCGQSHGRRKHKVTTMTVFDKRTRQNSTRVSLRPKSDTSCLGANYFSSFIEIQFIYHKMSPLKVCSSAVRSYTDCATITTT